MKRLNGRTFLGLSASLLFGGGIGAVRFLLPHDDGLFMKQYWKSPSRDFPKLNGPELLSEPKAIYNEIANLAPWHVTMSKITFQAGLNQISFWFFTEAIAKVGRANIQKGEVEKIDGWYVPKITTSLASLEKTFTETF